MSASDRKPEKLYKSGTNAPLLSSDIPVTLKDKFTDPSQSSPEKLAKKRFFRGVLGSLIALIFFGLCYGFLVGFGTHSKSRLESAPVASENTQKLQNTPPPDSPFYPVADSKTLLEQFFKARSVDEVLKCVWDDGQVRSRLGNYYSRAGIQFGGEIVSSLPRVAVTSNRTVHWWMVKTPDEVLRIAGVMWDHGKPHLLWENFIGYGDVSWEEFLSKRSLEPVVLRVVMCTAVPDMTQQNMTGEIVEISHPDSTMKQLAIVKDPVLAKHIREFFLTGEQGALATLEMKFPDNAKENTYPEILRLVWANWGEKNLDDSQQAQGKLTEKS